jgi:hypothetical protein
MIKELYNCKWLKIYFQVLNLKFTTVPGNDSLLLQGNYFGISVLEKKSNQWVLEIKLKDLIIHLNT